MEISNAPAWMIASEVELIYKSKVKHSVAREYLIVDTGIKKNSAVILILTSCATSTK